MAPKKTGGDEYAAKRKPGANAAPAPGGNGSVPGISDVQASSDRAVAAGLAFGELLLRSDGWLRCVPAGDGKLSYFKWKFSSGPHKGRYVMYVAHYTGWIDGILGLVEKLDEVDREVRRPAMDTFYDPR